MKKHIKAIPLVACMVGKILSEKDLYLVKKYKELKKKNDN